MRLWVWVGLLLLAGCASLPEKTPPVDEGLLRTRYEEDQRQRREEVLSWEVGGILDLESEETGERRVRITSSGVWGQWGRMEVIGPFQQLMRVVTFDATRLTLLDPPGKRGVMQTPSARGLASLTGIAVDPFRFQDLLLAGGGALQTLNGQEGEWLSRDGEHLVLDGVTGRILSRRGATSGSEPYRVDYLWPEVSRKPGVVLPDRLTITWGKANRLKVRFANWQTDASPRTPPVPATITVPDDFRADPSSLADQDS
ncbi:MAG: hypothetical protein HQL56_05310 [Magnetococcales bacterium]|nr:hypothetical protein [Magnetococcales bacterium]